MEIRHIRSFVVVAEECHFGKAALKLHLAQPSLSSQIKQLERDLGAELLARSTRRVELTAAGARFLERARHILTEIDAAGAEIGRISACGAAQVTISFTGSATYDVLPALARTLRTEMPEIQLDLRGDMLTPIQVDGLLDGVIDVGLLRPPVRRPGIEVHTLRREQLVAAVPSNHAIAKRDSVRLIDLRDEAFVTYPSDHRSVVYDAVLDACQHAGFCPIEVHEVRETSTLLSFVAADLGVALLPSSAQQAHVRGVDFLQLDDNTPPIELAMATRSGPEPQHIGWIREHIEQLCGPVD